MRGKENGRGDGAFLMSKTDRARERERERESFPKGNDDLIKRETQRLLTFFHGYRIILSFYL